MGTCASGGAARQVRREVFGAQGRRRPRRASRDAAQGGGELLQLRLEHGAAAFDDDFKVDLAPVRLREELSFGFAQALRELFVAHRGSVRLGSGAQVALVNGADLIFRER